ncbi:MAG: prepilin-type N-terminal cleavage/methylation domain-containing protein [Gemmatimonadota bacterium]
MRDRRGVTFVELLIVFAVSAILLGIAWTATGRARSAFAVRSARNAFASLSARARATAVERGHLVYLDVTEDGDSAWISEGGPPIEVLRFDVLAQVEVTPTLRQCLGPRGLALPGCGSVGGPVQVRFTRDGRWAEGTLLPLGQFVEGPQGP